ncbi:MAG: hydrogenase maturation nickel metallochaperone HypA [Propionibacteriaceae bacterium]|nr:hydrogenase maturation nickel metallochaperone HypA [Propionibacteriaceae bacterium]
MHELSLCQSISKIVHRGAAGRKVAVVELDVGQLRQVVPESLIHCWSIVSQGTDLDGSRLDIRWLRAVLVCRECGSQTQLEELPVLRCGSCSSTSVDIVSGDEFMVRSLVLEDTMAGPE